MPKLDDIATTLAAVPLFAQLSTKERRVVAKALGVHDVADDVMLVRQGESGDTFYVLLEGQAKVVRKVQGNQFSIRTSGPNVEVFWRVEAVRNDRWVQKNGAPVEETKDEVMRGYYIQPDLYGLPESKGREAALRQYNQARQVRRKSP